MKRTPEEALKHFLSIVEKLRDPLKGCPWDKEQTYESLRPLLLEEVYEVMDAVEKDPSKIVEELGDVMSLIGLYCQIGKDRGDFSMADVLEAISEKLIRRHPHVFGDLNLKSTSEVMTNWEKIKQTENKEDGPRKSMLANIPDSMPALLRAHRIGEKCARVGFEWNQTSEVRDKVLEEVREFLEAVDENPSDDKKQREEFGDILFALSQLSRRLGYNSEELLARATNKFKGRFQKIEELAYERGRENGITGMTLGEMDALWNEVKQKEKNS